MCVHMCLWVWLKYYIVRVGGWFGGSRRAINVQPAQHIRGVGIFVYSMSFDPSRGRRRRMQLISLECAFSRFASESLCEWWVSWLVEWHIYRRNEYRVSLYGDGDINIYIYNWCIAFYLSPVGFGFSELVVKCWVIRHIFGDSLMRLPVYKINVWDAGSTYVMRLNIHMPS